MARTVGWLPRLSTLRTTVERSTRTHYGRRDFEQLFQLQPRAANLLIDLLPTVQVGSSYFVEQPALARFLVRLDESPDPAAEMRRMERAKKHTKLRHGRLRLQALVEDGIAPRTLDALPEYVSVEPGRVTIDCGTVEQLVVALYAFSHLLDHDLNALAARIETPPATPAAEAEDAAAVRDMFRELEGMEAARKAGRDPSVPAG